MTKDEIVFELIKNFLPEILEVINGQQNYGYPRSDDKDSPSLQGGRGGRGFGEGVGAFKTIHHKEV